MILLFIACTRSASVTSAPALHTLWDYSDPASTHTRLTTALGTQAVDSPYALELRTQIARTHSLRGQFAQAHAILDAIEPFQDVSPAVKARYHLERGRTFRSAKQEARALPHFQAAFEADASDDLTIDAAHMLAITKGPEQTDWHDRALGLARSTKDERARRWLGSLLNNKAWAKHDADELEEALQLFREAEIFFADRDDNKKHHIAKYSVGRCLRTMGRVDEAWQIQHALVESNDGYVYEELGELALMRGEPAAAWFAEAHAALSEDAWFVENESERLARMQRLATVAK